MSDKTIELLHETLAISKELGASATEAISFEETSQNIEVKNGKLEKAERSETIGLGVRVFLDNKAASVSSSTTDIENIREVIKRAIGMAEVAPQDNFIGLAENKHMCKKYDVAALDLFDQNYESVTPTDLKEKALEMEDALLAVKGVSLSEGSSASGSRVKKTMVNSSGFFGSYEKTNFNLFCGAISGHSLEMERDHAFETRCHIKDMPSPRKIGILAGNRAVARQKPKKPPTGIYPVVFDRRVSSTLIGHLASALNGASLVRGSSWLLNCAETVILPESICVTEDPTRPKINGSKPFDSEGVGTQKKQFIENGIYKKNILDLRTSRRLGLEPTGNASRSLSSAPFPASGNIEMTPGSKTAAELLTGISEGLLVTSLIGSTINPNTGDYSRGANGFWIQNGKITHPVNECTIAGNLREMFLDLIPANDLDNFKTVMVPSLLIRKMTVAGK